QRLEDRRERWRDERRNQRRRRRTKEVPAIHDDRAILCTEPERDNAKVVASWTKVEIAAVAAIRA
ncbi:MAG TPA: hypothetical protein VNG89_13870, partial [Vicinamibacterales bacterium]|nr:hypothetical protein [Vicinamibacterales bacterium]